MDDVEQLLTGILADIAPVKSVDHWTYRDLFREFAGIDPFAADAGALADALAGRGVAVPAGMQDAPLDAWLDLCMTHLVEPRLGRGLLFVRDYPASQAALARLRSGNPPVAARFEAYIDGIELANGFHELADAGEQRRRFAQDNELRRQQGLEPVPADEHLLAALQAGLPDCAGVALGIDRLLAVAGGVRSLDDVMTFPVETA